MQVRRFGLSVVGVALFALAACATGGSGRGSPSGAGDTGPAVRTDGGGLVVVPDTAVEPITDSGVSIVDAGPQVDDAGEGSLDAGASDAGAVSVDSGNADAGGFVVDAAVPECVTEADCQDGLLCNGVETCTAAGVCVPGTAVVCADSVSCTVDRCLEPTGACEHSADDSLCGPSSTCSVSEGCVSAPMCDSPCELVSQCGCDRGEGCYVNTTGLYCAAAGSAATGSSCVGPGDCQAGSICVGISTEAASTAAMCQDFCAVDGDCGPDAMCLTGYEDGAGGTFGLCTAGCDPIFQLGCPAGSACGVFLDDTATRSFSDCYAPVGTRVQGRACTTTAQCGAGYVCLDPDGTGARASQCLSYCDSDTGFGCDSGYLCFGLDPAAVVDGATVGVCD